MNYLVNRILLYLIGKNKIFNISFVMYLFAVLCIHNILLRGAEPHIVAFKNDLFCDVYELFWKSVTEIINFDIDYLFFIKSIYISKIGNFGSHSYNQKISRFLPIPREKM